MAAYHRSGHVSHRWNSCREKYREGYIALLLTTLVLVMTVVGQGQSDWYEPFPAHKVVGNVYYVGSKDLATFLITTAEGHLLINSGFDRTVPLIQESVESLGFKMTDVNILPPAVSAFRDRLRIFRPLLAGVAV
jgi:hypothetical protein